MWFVRIFVYASYFPLFNKELESISDPSVISSVLSTASLLNALGACLGGLLCSGLKLNSQITFVLMALLCGVSGALWFTVFRESFQNIEIKKPKFEPIP
jgi:predicted MFS family arabinose efflux permease